MNIILYAVIDERGGMGNHDHLFYTEPSVVVRYLAELSEGKTVIVGSRVPSEVYRELCKKCDDIAIFANDRLYTNPLGAEIFTSIPKVTGRAICKDVLIVGDIETCEIFEPLADKMHLTIIHRIFPSSACFPRLEESKWKEVGLKELTANDLTGWKISFKEFDRRNITA